MHLSIEDSNSSNGTTVNGHPIRAATLVNYGDQIGLAGFPMSVEMLRLSSSVPDVVCAAGVTFGVVGSLPGGRLTPSEEALLILVNRGYKAAHAKTALDIAVAIGIPDDQLVEEASAMIPIIGPAFDDGYANAEKYAARALEEARLKSGGDR